MKKIVLFVFLWSVIIFSVQASDKIVAMVNDEIITQKELNDYLKITKLDTASDGSLDADCNLEEKKETLHKLIEDKLIVQEARKSEMMVSDRLVQERLDDFISQFKYRQDFEDALIEKGLSIADLKKRIKGQILMKRIINKEVRAGIDVNPFEITEFYQEHKDKFNASASLEYEGLQFSQQARAMEVYDELKRSQDKKYILGKYPDNIIKGVLFQGQAREELQPLFEKEQEHITEPIDLDGEYYIFWIKEKTPSEIRSIEEVKDRIWEIMYQTKFTERFVNWINELKEKAVIEIFEVGC